jgi:hypothetical protein
MKEMIIVCTNCENRLFEIHLDDGNYRLKCAACHWETPMIDFLPEDD